MDKAVFVEKMEGYSAAEIDYGLQTLCQSNKIMIVNDEIYIAY
jgi:hypothetical protein